jgi:hypothetical protein
MAEVLVEYSDPVIANDGAVYMARACGAETDNGMWHGWLEFIERDTGATLRSARETTQPNRTDTLYWATGLTAVYLEGALERSLHPLVKAPAAPTPQPFFDHPAPDLTSDPAYSESVLNPFSVYRKGEALLRRQLMAFSAWHLVNIIRAHRLSSRSSVELNALGTSDLIDVIVAGVQSRTDRASLRDSSAFLSHRGM